MNKDYFEYKGVKYGVGTKVIVDDLCWGKTDATFYGWQSRGSFRGSKFYGGIYINEVDKKIVEIVEPVYWSPPEPKNDSKKSNIFIRTGSGSYQSDDEIAYGLIWYIVIMIVGTIFNDNWIIWIAATIIFFGWKNTK